MTNQELLEIVDKAEAHLLENNIPFIFATAARHQLSLAAAGFPWFVHVLGQEALIKAWDEDRRVVNESDIETAISSLARSRYAQKFSDKYQQAVGDSSQREIVLRLLAKWPHGDVPSSAIYPLAKQLSVSNPSAPKADLLKERYGEVIVKPPHQDRGLVRFRDAMFKQYIDLRSSIYADVKLSVDAAWDAWKQS
jgi:hypothetical protein